jgi:hypothetical protein
LAAPTIVWLAMRQGAAGGALSWALLGVVYAIVGTLVTGRKIADFAGFRWLLRDIAVPLVLALMPALAGAWLCGVLDASPWVETFIAFLSACIGIVAGGFYSPFARQQALSFLGVGSRPCPN